MKANPVVYHLNYVYKPDNPTTAFPLEEIAAWILVFKFPAPREMNSCSFLAF